MINIDGNINRIIKGSESINKVYVGNDLVWQKIRPTATAAAPPQIIDTPLTNWLHLQPGSPSSDWSSRTNYGFVQIGDSPIKQFPNGKRGAARTFDYGRVVIPDATGGDAGNIVITFESQLRADHDVNKRNLELFLVCNDANISAFDNNPIVAGEVIALPRTEELETTGKRWISYGQYPATGVSTSSSYYRNVNRDHFPIDTSAIGSPAGICVANTTNMSDNWRDGRDGSAKNNFQISFSIHTSDEWYDKNFTLYYRHAEGTNTWHERITFNVVSHTDAFAADVAAAAAAGVAAEDIYYESAVTGEVDMSSVTVETETTFDQRSAGATENTHTLTDSQGNQVQAESAAAAAAAAMRAAARQALAGNNDPEGTMEMR